MKIIAKTDSGYLVEASAHEIMLSAGYTSSYDDGWKAITRQSDSSWSNDRVLPIGTTVDIRAAHDFHQRIAQHQDKAKSAAGILRAMADMMDGAMPDVIVPPVASATTEEEIA